MFNVCIYILSLKEINVLIYTLINNSISIVQQTKSSDYKFTSCCSQHHIHGEMCSVSVFRLSVII